MWRATGPSRIPCDNGRRLEKLREYRQGQLSMEPKRTGMNQYRWIVRDPDLLGGKAAVRGTRFSVSFLLQCLAEGMTAAEIDSTYGTFPHEALPEILMAAAEALDAATVAA